MAQIKRYTISDVVGLLPEIVDLNSQDYGSIQDDYFICSLGFEDRNTAIPKALSETEYSAKHVVLFVYNTNKKDNSKNKMSMDSYLGKISSDGNIKELNSDNDDFSDNLRNIFNNYQIDENGGPISVTIDISTCTSKIILYFIRIGLEYNINLKILYTEAAMYRPTKEEYDKAVKMNKVHQLGISKDISKIFASKLHTGENNDSLVEMLILFATYASDRTETVISSVNPDISRDIDDPNSSLIWILGDPHLQENHWRVDAAKKINHISDNSHVRTFSTFKYQDTILGLEELYADYHQKYHINLSPFGSKLQLVGMGLFYYMRPKCTIILSTPKKYNAKKYSDGVGKSYLINFGSLIDIRKILDKLDTLEIVHGEVDE